MVPDRVLARIFQRCTSVGDCLVSTYSVGSHGYAQVGWHDQTRGRSVMVLVHRAAWELLRGPIPAGMTVDHICRNRRCLSIDHLRLVSNEDNARDNGQSRRTHCPHGHRYEGANVKRTKQGHRVCRTCANEQRRAVT